MAPSSSDYPWVVYLYANTPNEYGHYVDPVSRTTWESYASIDNRYGWVLGAWEEWCKLHNLRTNGERVKFAANEPFTLPQYVWHDGQAWQASRNAAVAEQFLVDFKLLDPPAAQEETCNCDIRHLWNFGHERGCALLERKKAC